MNFLFSNLPVALKRRLFTKVPETVRDFIKQLKSFIRETKYFQQEERTTSKTGDGRSAPNFAVNGGDAMQSRLNNIETQMRDLKLSGDSPQAGNVPLVTFSRDFRSGR